MKCRFLFSVLCVSALVAFPTQSTSASAVSLLEPEPVQRQAVDALRNLDASPYQLIRQRFDDGKEPLDTDFAAPLSGR